MPPFARPGIFVLAMSTFTCESCRKEWTENYCPDCGQAIQTEEYHPEDEVDAGDSLASIPARVRANPFRYLWFEPEFRGFFQAWFVLLGLLIFTAYIQWWILAGVLLAVWIADSLFLLRCMWPIPRFYRRHLLIPAMIVSQRPLEYIAMIDMDSGTGEPAYAIKREAVPWLPCHSHELGTRFPCIASIHGSGESGRWSYFYAIPVSFGTGNAVVLERCIERLGDEEFARLLEAYEQGNYPTTPDETVWL